MNNTETERSPRQIAEQIIDEHLDEMMSPREYASTCKALIDGVEKALRDRDERAAKIADQKGSEWDSDDRYGRWFTAAQELASAIRGKSANERSN
jgi:hypothetical protein